MADKNSVKCIFCELSMRHDSLRAHLIVCPQLKKEPYVRKQITAKIEDKAKKVKTKDILKAVDIWRVEAAEQRGLNNSDSSDVENAGEKVGATVEDSDSDSDCDQNEISGEKADAFECAMDSENPHVDYEKLNTGKTTKGWLYFLIHPAFPGIVKVGHSKNMKSRLHKLQKSYDCDALKYLRCVQFAMVLDAKAAEDAVHSLLSKAKKQLHPIAVVEFFTCSRYASGKTEWFRLTHSEIHTLADLFQLER